MVDLVKFDAKIPYWATFRVPTAINFILSYSVPPPTTIFGMIMNALGYPQDEDDLKNDLEIAIQVLEFGEKIWDTISYMKIREGKTSIVKENELKKIQEGNDEIREQKKQELKEEFSLKDNEVKKLFEGDSRIYKEDFKG